VPVACPLALKSAEGSVSAPFSDGGLNACARTFLNSWQFHVNTPRVTSPIMWLRSSLYFGDPALCVTATLGRCHCKLNLEVGCSRASLSGDDLQPYRISRGEPFQRTRARAHLTYSRPIEIRSILTNSTIPTTPPTLKRDQSAVVLPLFFTPKRRTHRTKICLYIKARKIFLNRSPSYSAGR
jgi:hypothetical protein